MSAGGHCSAATADWYGSSVTLVIIDGPCADYFNCSITLGNISGLYSVADDSDSCSVALKSIGGLYTTAAHCGGEH